MGQWQEMRVSAKADYAARAAAELSTATDKPIKADRIAEAQDIPAKFLETILLELKHAGIVRSQRDVAGQLLRGEHRLVPIEVTPYLRDVYDHLLRVHDLLEAARAAWIALAAADSTRFGALMNLGHLEAGGSAVVATHGIHRPDWADTIDYVLVSGAAA